MTKLVITMTIEPRYDWVENACSPNDILFINSGVDSPSLSAIVWTFIRNNESIADTRSRALYFILEKVNQVFPNWQRWLIVSDKAVQQDTRITRHLKLWKGLQKRGIEFSLSQYSEESSISDANGIRFFGAIKWNNSEFDKVLFLIMEEQAFIVFFDPIIASKKIKSVVQTGWEFSRLRLPKEILQAVYLDDGLIIDMFGEFDDPDVTVVLLGRKEVLNTFRSMEGKLI